MLGKYQRALLGCMLAAMSVLLLGQAFLALRRREPETAVAVPYRGQTVRVTGTVLRQETAVALPEGGTPAVADGEKVSVGQALLAPAAPPENILRRRRVLRHGLSAANQPLPARAAALHAAIGALSGASGAERTALTEEISGLIAAGRGTDRLRTELELLEESDCGEAAAAEPVRAPVSGIFTAHMGDTGRIVTGDTWKLRVELPFWPETGQTLTAELLSGVFRETEMTVEAVEGGAGGCRALLSCGSHMAEAARIRRMTVKILKNTEMGLEIPSRAIYTEEEETGVWCLVGDSSRWKPVTILEDLGETVLVEPGGDDPGGLQPGDEVILGKAG